MSTPSTTSPQRRTLEQWRRLVAEQEHSALSQQRFCQARGVPYSSFTRWRRRVLAERDGGGVVAPSPPPASAFVPLALAPSTPPPRPADTPPETLSLTLANGLRIEGIGADTVETVAALVRAL